MDAYIKTTVLSIMVASVSHGTRECPSSRVLSGKTEAYPRRAVSPSQACTSVQSETEWSPEAASLKPRVGTTALEVMGKREAWLVHGKATGMVGVSCGSLS